MKILANLFGCELRKERKLNESLVSENEKLREKLSAVMTERSAILQIHHETTYTLWEMEMAMTRIASMPITPKGSGTLRKAIRIAKEMTK